MKTILPIILAAVVLTGCSFTRYQRGDISVMSGSFFRNNEVGKIQVDENQATNGTISYKLTIGGLKSATEAEALGTILGTALKTAK